MYEIYRQVVDSKAKDKKLSTRVDKISEKVSKIKEEGERLSTILQQSHWEIRYFSYAMSTDYFSFCFNPCTEQAESCV